jgi:hypothetical protein
VLDPGAEATRLCSLVDERLLVTMEHFIIRASSAIRNSAVWNSAYLTQVKNTGDRLLSDVRAIPVAMIECLFRL